MASMELGEAPILNGIIPLIEIVETLANTSPDAMTPGEVEVLKERELARVVVAQRVAELHPEDLEVEGERQVSGAAVLPQPVLTERSQPR